MEILVQLRGVLPLAIALLAVAAREFVVDDNDPAILYAPSDQWSQGAQCSTCSIHPDPTQTLNRTWHDSTYDPSTDADPRVITFKFTGTSVSVFNILPPVQDAGTSHVDLTFELDGSSVSTFTYDPSADSGFQYGHAVFSSPPLTNGQHALVVRTTSGVESVVLFDYIVYTVPDPPVSSSSSSTIDVTTINSPTPESSSSSSSPGSGTTASSTSVPTPISAPSSALQAISSAASPSAASPGSPTSPSASDSAKASLPSMPTGPTVPSTGTGTLDLTSETQSLDGTVGVSPTASTVAALPQSTSTGRTIPVGAVIGGAAGGGVLLLILLATLVYCLCIRRVRHLSFDLEVPKGDDEATAIDAHFPSLHYGQGPLSATQEHLMDTSNRRSVNPSTLRRASLSFRRARDSHHSSDVIAIGAPTPASPVSEYSSDSITPCPPSSQPPRTSVSQSLTEKPSDPLPPPILPVTSIIVHENVPPTIDTRVLEQISALQQEVARLRVHHERAALLVDAPPRYNET
ncbi:hypothetical protein BV20DRAFT_1043890 [Pilatotrama ljubarskyi]|nr:hypothetical protein BV20DRAFT_1043890 [Pilatotrama ljubarskyi]